MTHSDDPSAGATYREIDAKSITRLRGTVDPWFLGRYGMNLYRGCEHGCLYCDGRAERYYVPGDFARDIVVKRNAVAVLTAELAKAREPGFVFLGGGVCDVYQPADQRYELGRGVLELVRDRRLPVHVLTKSALVERDFDLLQAIHERRGAILSFSIQTLDDAVRARFEPGAAPTFERLRLLSKAKELGLGVGVMAVPVLPGISDMSDAIDRLVATLADVGVNFVGYGGLTLRPGIQRDTYLAVIREHYPELLDGYHAAYRSRRPSGMPARRYLDRVEKRFARALARHGLTGRPPRRLFRGLMPIYAEVAVALEHHEHAQHAAGSPPSGLGRVGWAIQQWARDNLAKRGRRKAFSYRVLEEEFRAMVADGSITALLDVDAPALRQIRALLSEDAPA